MNPSDTLRVSEAPLLAKLSRREQEARHFAYAGEPVHRKWTHCVRQIHRDAPAQYAEDRRNFLYFSIRTYLLHNMEIIRTKKEL